MEELKQTKIRLFPRGDRDNEYHVGDSKEDRLINLKDVTFFLFIHKDNPNDRVLIIRQKTNQ